MKFMEKFPRYWFFCARLAVGPAVAAATTARLIGFRRGFGYCWCRFFPPAGSTPSEISGCVLGLRWNRNMPGVAVSRVEGPSKRGPISLLDGGLRSPDDTAAGTSTTPRPFVSWYKHVFPVFSARSFLFGSFPSILLTTPTGTSRPRGKNKTFQYTYKVGDLPDPRNSPRWRRTKGPVSQNGNAVVRHLRMSFHHALH